MHCPLPGQKGMPPIIPGSGGLQVKLPPHSGNVLSQVCVFSPIQYHFKGLGAPGVPFPHPVRLLH